MEGTERSVWRMPSPTSRLASRISPSPAASPVMTSAKSPAEVQHVIGFSNALLHQLLARKRPSGCVPDWGALHGLIGMPGAVPQHRKHHAQTKQAGGQREQ